MDSSKRSSLSSKAEELKKKVEGMPPALFLGIQVVVGLLIAWLIYYISLAVMNADKLVIDTKFDANRKAETQIISGYADSSSFAEKSFNTSIDSVDSYVPLRHSVNLKGGAQYSYSFWLYVGDGSVFNNQVLFLHGDAAKYNYTVTDSITKTRRSVHDYVSFAPIFALGSNSMEFSIQFNTLHNLKEELKITTLKSENDALRQNMLSLFAGKWMMITVVFEDNMPISDFESGVVVKFYANDTLYQVGRYNTTLKQNNGNLYLLPGGSVTGLKVADMSYFNYALDDTAISKRWRKGPSDKAAQSIKSAMIPANMLTDANRTNTFNT